MADTKTGRTLTPPLWQVRGENPDSYEWLVQFAFSAPDDLDDAKKLTHDAAIAVAGPRRRSRVGWMFIDGRDRICDFITTEQANGGWTTEQVSLARDALDQFPDDVVLVIGMCAWAVA